MTIEEGFDVCAGCKRVCLQKRPITKPHILEIEAICAAPWCAQVLSRKRELPPIDGADPKMLGGAEYAIVCSQMCFMQMRKDPAWLFVPRGERWADPPSCRGRFYIGDDELAPKYGSTGLPPFDPEGGWVLLPDREPVTAYAGPFR